MTNPPEPAACPRVEVASYVVYPTGYDQLVMSDRDCWCLTVTDGSWGWRITRGRGVNSEMAMNRLGQWVVETRGDRGNRARRFPRAEALRLAAKYVDTAHLNGLTAAQASAHVAARLAAQDAAQDADSGGQV